MTQQRIASAALELTTDATKFNKGLGDAEKRARSFKDVLSDPRALKDFGSKVTDAGKAVSVGLTLPLIGVGAAVLNAGRDMDAAFDTIRKGTGATGDDLEALKGSFRAVFKNVPDDAQTVASAIADINTRTGAAGPLLETLATRMLTLARLSGQEVGPLIAQTTRLFGDWSISTDNQAGSLDFLWKTSQSTGIGIDALSEKVVQFGAPLRQLGFSFEESTAILGKWEKEGVNTEKVLSSLTIGVGQLATQGVSSANMATVFRARLEAIRTSATPVTDAIKLFGKKAGPDMAAAISEGRFSVDALVASLQASRETIPQAAEDTDDFSEKWRLVRNNVTLALEPLGIRMLDALNNLTPALAAAGERLSGVLSMFTALPRPVQTATFAVVGFAAVVGPLTFVLGSLATVIAKLSLAKAALMGVAFQLGNSIPILTARLWLLEAATTKLGFAMGVLGKAVAVVAVAWASWKVGTWIGEVSGLTDWVGRKAAALMGVSEAEYNATRAAAKHAETQSAQQHATEGVIAAFNQQIAATGQKTQADQLATTQEIRAAAAAEAGASRRAAAAKAAQEYASRIREIAESLGGADAMKKANDYIAALDKVGSLHTLTKGKQEEVLAATAAALESYKALGTQAPVEIQKVHDELVTLVVLPQIIADANKTAAAEVARIREEQRARELEVFKEMVEARADAMAEARNIADRGYLASLTDTERMVELARRQRDESIRAIKPIEKAFPEVYKQALAQIEAEFNDSITFQKTGWGGFFDSMKEMITGGKGIKGMLGNIGNMIVPHLGGKLGEVVKIGNAAAKAFSGDFSAATALAQEYISKFVGWATNKLKSLFGGPSAQELEGRESAKAFRDQLAGMMTDQQKLEAGNNEWAKSVIVVRDAFMAVGRTEREALDAMDALWRAEKEGAGAVEREMAKINAVLAQQKTLAEQTAKVEQDLRAQSDARMKEMDGHLQDLMKTRESLAQSIANEAPEEVMGVIEAQTRGQIAALDAQIAEQQDKMQAEAEAAAKALEEALGAIKPKTITVPYTFAPTNTLPDGTSGVTVPVTPMGEGGFGRVTRPRLFLAGERGAEDFAFSGGGRSFGDLAAGGSNRPLEVNMIVDGRKVARAMVPHIPAAVGALG